MVYNSSFLVFNFVKAFTVDFVFWINCIIYALGNEKVQFYTSKKVQLYSLDYYPFFVITHIHRYPVVEMDLSIYIVCVACVNFLLIRYGSYFHIYISLDLECVWFDKLYVHRVYIIVLY